MNDIKRLLFRDIKINIKSVLFKLGIFFAFYFLLNWAEIQVLKSYQLIDVKSVILENFKGCEFGGSLANNFVFPIKWLLINAYILYVIGDYFYKDIKVNSKYILVRNKKLWQIFISKIIWAFLVILFYYSVLLLMSVVLGVAYYFPYNDMAPYYYEMDTNNLIITVLLLYSLTSLTLCIILYTLSFKLKPIYCFLIAIIICVSSVFFESSFFPGQHNLVLRHDPFDTIHNLSIGYSILYNIVLSFIFLLAGIFISRKKEIF
ncbi:hypothetical protein [Clostridium sp. UBA871]|uniref:hypothetical protein n=1 Tax=Clostridium sp. UBA871 TaxID=1946380 RepID=UPI003217C0BD